MPDSPFVVSKTHRTSPVLFLAVRCGPANVAKKILCNLHEPVNRESQAN